jgi:hypothetical protein
LKEGVFLVDGRSGVLCAELLEDGVEWVFSIQKIFEVLGVTSVNAESPIPGLAELELAWSFKG